MEPRTLAAVPDDELLHRLAELLRQSRRLESEIVEHIAEVDGRRLFAREGTPSMFEYCTNVLHLSEAEASCASRWLESHASIRCSCASWPTAVFT